LYFSGLNWRRWSGRHAGGRRSLDGQGACTRLDLAYRQLPSNDLIGELELDARILDGKQGTGVPCGYVSSLK
jgi:hypothetical protein